MSCFCFGGSSSQHSKESKRITGKLDDKEPNTAERVDDIEVIDDSLPVGKRLSYQEIEIATKKFNPECLVEEAGIYGKVYRGTLENTGEIVAIEHLDRRGSRRRGRDYLLHVKILSRLNHPNVIRLIGYCDEGNDCRYLVHEYLSLGSLDKYLHDRSSLQTRPLDWDTRMKIASGIAMALEYLHNKADPPIIYRNLCPFTISLDDNFNPKLFDFGLSKVGPFHSEPVVSKRIVGTYFAPEYGYEGVLSLGTDVFCLGLVLLELISGRRSYEIASAYKEHKGNCQSWVCWILEDRKRILDLVDPILYQGGFTFVRIYQALVVANMCVQEKPKERPVMSDVVSVIRYISSEESLEDDNINNLPI